MCLGNQATRCRRSLWRVVNHLFRLVPALAVDVDRADGPTNHHSQKRGSGISAHSAADDRSRNASDEAAPVVTSEGASDRVGFNRCGFDLSDVVSSVLLDDLRKSATFRSATNTPSGPMRTFFSNTNRPPFCAARKYSGWVEARSRKTSLAAPARPGPLHSAPSGRTHLPPRNTGLRAVRPGRSRSVRFLLQVCARATTRSRRVRLAGRSRMASVAPRLERPIRSEM